MAIQQSNELTGFGQKFLQVSWQQGPCSVKDIAALLNQDNPDAYTPVQTFCRILLNMGHGLAGKQDKTFNYPATTIQQEVRSQALLSLLKKSFGGSALDQAATTDMRDCLLMRGAR